MTAPGPHVPVTSSTHAFAVTMYAGMIVLGVAHVTGIISSRAIQEVLASPWEQLWAGLHLIAPIMAATGCGRETAEAARQAAAGHVKTAIVMVKTGCDAAQAQAKLEQAAGHVRRALD